MGALLLAHGLEDDVRLPLVAEALDRRARWIAHSQQEGSCFVEPENDAMRPRADTAGADGTPTHLLVVGRELEDRVGAIIDAEVAALVACCDQPPGGLRPRSGPFDQPGLRNGLAL